MSPWLRQNTMTKSDLWKKEFIFASEEQEFIMVENVATSGRHVCRNQKLRDPISTANLKQSDPEVTGTLNSQGLHLGEENWHCVRLITSKLFLSLCQDVWSDTQRVRNSYLPG